ncbi:hypothetical protein M422DRAFT_257700 [Sphaerobolus stellatus SS14]|uniref:Unplaced genomic scaffold SPHSTscaffold_77, whole genome shotgun sequence n=1 Tax=Sphaerobolus stellatus (strain SS14) TaxID=990650 RepID=A0A0C9U8N5_SPHS4|nr:hypothetical protein M422DRAFT_257700 [Sphaerobolus stellatus SS14]
MKYAIEHLSTSFCSLASFGIRLLFCTSHARGIPSNSNSVSLASTDMTSGSDDRNVCIVGEAISIMDTYHWWKPEGDSVSDNRVRQPVRRASITRKKDAVSDLRHRYLGLVASQKVGRAGEIQRYGSNIQKVLRSAEGMT